MVLRQCSIISAVVLSLLAFSGAVALFGAALQESDSHLDVTQLLQKFAELSPDPCGPPYGNENNWHSGDLESRLFQLAEEMITKELNATSDINRSPQKRALEALNELEQLSASVNSAWPEKNRFHFQVLDFSPALVIKVSIRTHDTYLVFGIPEIDNGKPNRLWKMVGSNYDYRVHEKPYSHLQIHVLKRGPSSRARFLAAFNGGGCAGSTGVAYDAREWDPEDFGNLEQVIKQDGAFGLDDKVPGFHQIGQLKTNGPLITLPYCWFSDIDTWDNPSLCALDSYDLSGDKIKFQSREYNRPDLLPIAKAIEYAKQRDYPAVLGYCASSQVARKLVRDILPFVFADDLRETRRGNDKRHVELGYEPTYSFDVQKFGDRWRVVAFSIK